MLKVQKLTFVFTLLVFAALTLQPTTALGAPGVEIYANSGSYWTQTGTAWGTASNAGYCYISGACSPKTVQWGWNVNPGFTINGKWDNIDYASSYGNVYVFIPSTNATALAHYSVVYNGGSVTGCNINQNNYYNQWVLCASHYLGPRNVQLNNYDPNHAVGTSKVGFDEIKLEY